MNIYQGLLFLHGFRVLPEDVTDGESAADGRCGAAAAPTPAAAVAGQGKTGGPTPAAGGMA